MTQPQVNQERELTRTEENDQHEEHQRKVHELMHRRGERQDWDV